MDVVITGDGSISVVAVHGIQGTRSAWYAVSRELESETRFLLPNLRGRGKATRGACTEDYQLNRFADDLGEVIQSGIGDRPFVLAGWSMGVSVCLSHIERAGSPPPKGLVLISGTPMLDQVQWFKGSGTALMAEIAEREVRLGLLEAADHDAVAWTWEAISVTSQLHILGSIDVPTLIIHGCEDADSPWPHAQRLAQDLPNARLVGLAGVGHNVLKEASATVVAELRSFLKSVNNEESA